jgi:hypothetical protein
MQIDYLTIVVLSVCAIFFYRAGRDYGWYRHTPQYGT